MFLGKLYFLLILINSSQIPIPIFLSEKHIHINVSIACIPTTVVLFVNDIKLYYAAMLALWYCKVL